MTRAKAFTAGFLAWLQRPWRHGALPLIFMALAACAGIAAADALPRCPPAVWLGLAAASALTVMRTRGRAELLILCAAAFAFAHHAGDRDPLREQTAAVLRPGAALSATLTGVIADDPEPDASGRNFSFPVTIGELTGRQLTGEFRGHRLYVRLFNGRGTLRYGDRIAPLWLLNRLPP